MDDEALAKLTGLGFRSDGLRLGGARVPRNCRAQGPTHVSESVLCGGSGFTPDILPSVPIQTAPGGNGFEGGDEESA